MLQPSSPPPWQATEQTASLPFYSKKILTVAPWTIYSLEPRFSYQNDLRWTIAHLPISKLLPLSFVVMIIMPRCWSGNGLRWTLAHIPISTAATRTEPRRKKRKSPNISPTLTSHSASNLGYTIAHLSQPLLIKDLNPQNLFSAVSLHMSCW